MDVRAPVDLARPMGLYLSWHLVLAAAYMLNSQPLAQAVPFVAVHVGLAVLVGIARWCQIGLGILLVGHATILVLGLPFTANCQFIVVLLLATTMLTSSPAGTPTTTVAERSEALRSTALFILMAVYAIAGLQKLAHGFWHDGELIAIELVAEQGDFGLSMQIMLEHIAALGGLPMPELANLQPTQIGVEPCIMPGWMITSVVWLSRGFVIAELLLPLAVLWPATRRLALAPTVLMQIAIGLTSWEIGFMCVALSCVVLSTRRPRRNLALVLASEVLLVLVQLALGKGS